MVLVMAIVTGAGRRTDIMTVVVKSLGIATVTVYGAGKGTGVGIVFAVCTGTGICLVTGLVIGYSDS